MFLDCPLPTSLTTWSPRLRTVPTYSQRISQSRCIGDDHKVIPALSCQLAHAMKVSLPTWNYVWLLHGSFLIIKDNYNNHFIINKQLLRGIHDLHRDAEFACLEHVCRAAGWPIHPHHIATSVFNDPLYQHHSHVYSHSKVCYSKVADTKP